MNFTSKDLRCEARQKLKNNWTTAIIICFISAVLPSSFLLLGSVFSISGISLSNYTALSAVADEALNATTASFETSIPMITLSVSAISFILIGFVASLIISSTMALGKASCFLELSNGKKTSVSTLFSSFSHFGKALSLFFVIFFKIFLWSLVAGIPGFVVTFFYCYNFFANNPSYVMQDLFSNINYWMIVSFCSIIPNIIVTTMAEYRYYLSFYVLSENPDIGAFEAVNQSKKMMYGHKWQAFKLELSFIGWIMLVGLTFGLALLWVSPYMEASKAAFFKRVSADYV